MRRGHCRCRVCRRRVLGRGREIVLNLLVERLMLLGCASGCSAVDRRCEWWLACGSLGIGLLTGPGPGSWPPVSYWRQWGSTPHWAALRGSTSRSIWRPRRAPRCVLGASNHACPPACSRADPVNGSYKHWQVRLRSPRRAPTAGARRAGRVGRLPGPLPLPAGTVPAAAAAHAHHTYTQPGPGEPRRCSDPCARSSCRAAAGF